MYAASLSLEFREPSSRLLCHYKLCKCTITLLVPSSQQCPCELSRSENHPLRHQLTKTLRYLIQRLLYAGPLSPSPPPLISRSMNHIVPLISAVYPNIPPIHRHPPSFASSLSRLPQDDHVDSGHHYRDFHHDWLQVACSRSQ